MISTLELTVTNTSPYLIAIVSYGKGCLWLQDVGFVFLNVDHITEPT